MNPTPLSTLVEFLDDLLGSGSHLDYPGAWNGLQVQGRPITGKVAVAVDASEHVIQRAIDLNVGLLFVHHGLFWSPERRIVGPHYRKLSLLVSNGMALYSSHLPLDRHAEVGNSALLIRALGLEPDEAFGDWKGQPVGWSAPAGIPRDHLLGTLERALPGCPLRCLDFGPPTIDRLAVVTGSAADTMPEAVAAGIYTLITGEAAHQHYAQARELGVNLVLAGHYATETFGVQAVGSRLHDQFKLPVTFLDDPSPF